MRKMVIALLAVSALCAHGSWYWPFGSDEDGTNAPPRLHRLLESANDYIELAQDASLNGDADKALENYRLALGELDRVEAENPDRAADSEFAPLRTRRAACIAAMDAIKFAQVNDNIRPVSVTDTTELQKRWNKKHGIKYVEDAPAPEAKPVEEPRPQVEEKAVAGAKPAEEEKPVSESVPAAEPRPPQQTVEEKPVAQPRDWNGRISQAMSFLRAQDYAGADVLLEAMLKERPKDLNALLLRAAAQVGTKSYFAAQRTLERAMRAHPRSYLPYYNLANLLLQQGGDLVAAKEYYELGRLVGGPANKAIEQRLNGEGK